MINIKVIFMGTPQFAVPILEELHKEHDIVLVVTQPDQYSYRKKMYLESPVKKWALANNIPLFQPEKIRKDHQIIFDIDADIIITAAYGQLVSEDILNYPQYKAINIHGSLLPAYRGGAPIQRALINGDNETGITIMYMAKKMDAGDILASKKIAIEDSDTQDSLFHKLSVLASEMINPFLQKLLNREITPQKQDENAVTYAFNLTKEDEQINFNNSSRAVYNQIRGLNANPGAYFILDNLPIKVYNSTVQEKRTAYPPGVIVAINKDSFDSSCGNETVISILDVQLPGKNIIKAKDFINGRGRTMLTIGKKIEVKKDGN